MTQVKNLPKRITKKMKCFLFEDCFYSTYRNRQAFIAQLGERTTEVRTVLGSIPSEGKIFAFKVFGDLPICWYFFLLIIFIFGIVFEVLQKPSMGLIIFEVQFYEGETKDSTSFY